MSLALWRKPLFLRALKHKNCFHQSAFSILVFQRFPSSTHRVSLFPCVSTTSAFLQQRRLASTHGGSQRGSAQRGEEEEGANAKQHHREKEPSAEDLNEEEYAHRVYDMCDYKDENLLVRLGFSPYEFVDEAKVKRHFFILAKKYHPDLPDAPPDASEAFQRIREAHDLAIRHIRSRGPFHEGEVHYFYADEVRRRVMVKALGAGVIFFLLATTFFIVVICRHNASRVDAMLLLSFLAIFFTLQVFPKLLAAAVLFAWHSSNYVKAKELTEKANVVVLAEKERHSLHFSVQGVSPSYVSDAIVQVTVMKEQQGTSSDTTTTTAEAAASSATTLTYGKGVLKVSLPCDKKGTQYRIKVVHDASQLVLFDQLLTV